MTIGRNFIQGQANRALKKVAGNFIGSVFGKTTTSPTASLNREKGSMSGIKGSEDFQHLAFPVDVMSDESTGNHGHYIMFYVNEQQKAKIRFTESMSGRQNVAKEVVQRKNDTQLKEMYEKMNGEPNPNKIKTDPVSEQVLADATIDKVVGEHGTPYPKGADRLYGAAMGKNKRKMWSEDKTFFFERKAVKRAKMAITMFMPAQITATYSANYTDTQMGAFTQDAMDAYNSLINNNFDDFGNIVGNMDENLKDQLNIMATTFLGGIPMLQGIREAEAMKEGRIFADRMELAFKGVPKRQFQYAFKMIPRNQKEADEVQQIIKAFKMNMLPEFMDGGNSRKMVVPNTFDIQYMYVNSENQYLNKIGESVLESMNVTYGGDRFKTFTGELGKGAPPVETTLTLSFKEFDFLTREKIVEGF